VDRALLIGLIREVSKQDGAWEFAGACGPLSLPIFSLEGTLVSVYLRALGLFLVLQGGLPTGTARPTKNFESEGSRDGSILFPRRLGGALLAMLVLCGFWGDGRERRIGDLEEERWDVEVRVGLWYCKADGGCKLCPAGDRRTE